MITEAKTFLKAMLRDQLLLDKLDLRAMIDQPVMATLERARKTYRGTQSPSMRTMTPSIIRESWLASLPEARN